MTLTLRSPSSSYSAHSLSLKSIDSNTVPVLPTDFAWKSTPVIMRFSFSFNTYSKLPRLKISKLESEEILPGIHAVGTNPLHSKPNKVTHVPESAAL